MYLWAGYACIVYTYYVYGYVGVVIQNERREKAMHV